MAIVSRSERHVITKHHPMFKVIDEYCFKSKNLYNYANYIVRQEFIKNNKWIRYADLTKEIKYSALFKEIGSNSGQHTLKMLDRNWKSFFKIIKDWSEHKEKYLGTPHIPRYLKKNGRYIFIMTNMQTKIRDGYLFFSFKPFKPYNNLIKTKVKNKHMQTRFIPKGDHYVLEIIYEKKVPDIIEKKNKRIIGIDLGIDRFATVQNNIGMKPFAINGCGIKSFNNYYNKLLAKYRSEAKKVNKLDWTEKLQKISTKRNNKIEYFLHCSSKKIADFCINNQIDTVVIGYNKKWKQNINIGKTNQSFVEIPFQDFVSKLEYKLEDVGIKLIKTEESYTSKASFLDNDQLCKSEFSGKRIHRGLYKTDKGKIINADVNGAGNIIRKVFPNAFGDGIKGVGLHPKIVNVGNLKLDLKSQ